MSSSPRRHEGLVPATLLLLGVVGAGVLGTALIGRSVEVGIPLRAGDPACTAASGHWPEEVDGEASRVTEPSAAAVRAWGDPAIVARCGVPAMPPTQDQCVVIDGIGWVAEDLGDGARLTTYGHDPAIEVIVPQEQGPGPLLLPAFSDAVRELPSNGRECS